MKAMIIAAGEGRRLRPLTEQMPKPLIQVGSKMLVEYHLLRLQRAGIREVVINTHHLGHLIPAALGCGKRYGLRIQYSAEEQLLGSGGGVLRALDYLGPDPFLLLSADVWTDFEMTPAFLAQSSRAHLLLVQDHDHPAGDFSVNDQSVLGYGEPRWAYAGVAKLDPVLFQEQPSSVFSLGRIFEQVVARGTGTGELYQGAWFNVGTPAQLERVRTVVSKQW